MRFKILGQKIIKPRLTLVGAGPGDADLITVKAIKALASANVVLYDALANEELLAYAPQKAKKIFVGKRAGLHETPQEEINRLIVENAFAYGHVVRLKGGDSFVFGRGHEELKYAETFDIPTQVVPGISSAIAAPALQQIPLTKRGTSESFWVLTGTTRFGTLSEDIKLAAQSTATVVILMGMSKLDEIIEIFKEVGKTNTAVAIIENSSTPQEKIGLGTIENIQEVVANKKLSAPAVIVIGNVVAEHPEFYQEISEVISYGR